MQNDRVRHNSICTNIITIFGYESNKKCPLVLEYLLSGIHLTYYDRKINPFLNLEEDCTVLECYYCSNSRQDVHSHSCSVQHHLATKKLIRLIRRYSLPDDTINTLILECYKKNFTQTRQPAFIKRVSWWRYKTENN